MLLAVVMARPLRIQYPGAAYHVMTRRGARQKVFFRKKDYELFVNTVGELYDRWRVEVIAYGAMGNHYHICLRITDRVRFEVA